MQKLEEIVNLTIAQGQSAGSVSFTPQAGSVIACAVFTNGAVNPGFVTAKLSTDSNDIISGASDIRNYRDRDAGYLEGKKPLAFEAGNRQLVFEVNATAAFATDFKCQLVLVYQKRECF